MGPLSSLKVIPVKSHLFAKKVAERSDLPRVSIEVIGTTTAEVCARSSSVQRASLFAALGISTIEAAA